jgi:glucosamine--fructose-6-phosphate aminotransferase (isomerizing)
MLRMCNLAGYAGHEAAAPILLEMTARQEGFAGGYYTGIATIADGQLHYEKVIGDVATLVRETDAKNLPGNVGIIHSRSKSGGDVEWGHPFIDCSGRMAYVANGIVGFFSGQRDRDAIAQRLADAGHTFRSRASGPIGTYPTLHDGSCVHFSEVMCCLIESFVAEGLPPKKAIQKAFQQYPAEIVGLMVHADAPNCVIASRINQPLMMGRKDGASYVATTAMAFPDGMQWVTQMPINASAVIEREGFHILPMEPLAGPVSATFPWKEGYERVLALLADGEAKGLGACINATASLWPEDAAPQADMMAYEILRDLHRQGLVGFRTVEMPGVLPNTIRAQRRAYLIRQ